MPDETPQAPLHEIAEPFVHRARVADAMRSAALAFREGLKTLNEFTPTTQDELTDALDVLSKFNLAALTLQSELNARWKRPGGK